MSLWSQPPPPPVISSSGTPPNPHAIIAAPSAYLPVGQIRAGLMMMAVLASWPAALEPSPHQVNRSQNKIAPLTLTYGDQPPRRDALPDVLFRSIDDQWPLDYPSRQGTLSSAPNLPPPPVAPTDPPPTRRAGAIDPAIWQTVSEPTILELFGKYVLAPENADQPPRTFPLSRQVQAITARAWEPLPVLPPRLRPTQIVSVTVVLTQSRRRMGIDPALWAAIIEPTVLQVVQTFTIAPENPDPPPRTKPISVENRSAMRQWEPLPPPPLSVPKRFPQVAAVGGINLLGIAWTYGQDGDSTSTYVGLKDTTGATLFVASLSYDVGSSPVLTDSKGSTWIPLPAQPSASLYTRYYYVPHPDPVLGVGPNHDFTVSGVLSYAVLHVAWYSGIVIAGAPLLSSSSTGAGTSLQPGSIVPSIGDLLVSTLGTDDQTTSETVSGGVTLIHSLPFLNSVHYGGYFAWGLCASVPVNPTWNWTTAVAAGTVLAAFSPNPITPPPGNIYYVSTTGTDGAGHTGAIGDPWRTFAYSASRMVSGDTLYIRQSGGWTETLDGSLFPTGLDFLTGAVTISGYPGETVTITPADTYNGIIITAARSYQIYQDLIIDGINQTIGGEAGGPDGVYLSTGATHNRFSRVEAKRWAGNGFQISENNVTADYNEVLDCLIHDNGARAVNVNRGYGIYLTSSHNLIEGCNIYGNNGYGIHINPGFSGAGDRNVIRNNLVHDNFCVGSAGTGGSTSFGIAVLWGDSCQVYNNILYGNQGGIEVYSGSTDCQVYNNTITGNTAVDPSGGVFLQYYFSAPIIRNNIVYNNGSLSIFDAGGGVGTPVIDHNLETDPTFVNAGTHDYHLQSGSAARDTGLTLLAVTSDYDSVVRPQGPAYDIGAFEYVVVGSVDSVTRRPFPIQIRMAWEPPFVAPPRPVSVAPLTLTLGNPPTPHGPLAIPTLTQTVLAWQQTWTTQTAAPTSAWNVPPTLISLPHTALPGLIWTAWESPFIAPPPLVMVAPLTLDYGASPPPSDPIDPGPWRAIFLGNPEPTWPAQSVKPSIVAPIFVPSASLPDTSDLITWNEEPDTLLSWGETTETFVTWNGE